MNFTERHQEYFHPNQPQSPMYVDGATPVEEKRVQVESQANIGLLLEAILEELRKMNSAPRESAGVSSVQIEDAAKGPPRITTKHYTDSHIDYGTAIEAHAAAHRLADAAYERQWVETVENLQP